jgi:hypothetical protein
MPPASQHLAAERAFRAMLADNGLPAADAVEYEEAGVVFLWHETKLAVVIELGDTGPRSVEEVRPLGGQGAAA